MADEVNGNLGEKQVPAFAVGWDAEAQDVVVQVDPRYFKNPRFVVAMLDMAKAKIETEMKLMQVQALKAKDAEMRRTQAIVNRIAK